MFDVYVEGATGTSPGAIRELASAMAARYGVPAADVQARLSRGRFRVKADVDRATAEAYARDLESIGARARIEPASGRPGDAARPGSSSLPPPARPGSSSLPPQPGARGGSSSLPPQPPSRPSAPLLPPQPAARPPRSSLPPPSSPSPAPQPRPMRSSLPPQPEAAEPVQTLGALERSGLLALATLDDEPAIPSSSDGMMPASMGPATPRAPTPQRSRNLPIDPFAPPEASAAEPLLELADDEIAQRVRQRTTAPPAAGDAARRQSSSRPPERPGPAMASPALAAPLAPARPSGAPAAPAAWPAASAEPTALPPAPTALPPAGSGVERSGSGRAALGLGGPRARFAVGIALAIVLGFIPANLVAGWRERSVYAAIDDKVIAAQSAADTPDSYAALDAFRAAQLDAKRSARRTIALTALLIWAAAGGAVAFGWFRLPWIRRASG